MSKLSDLAEILWFENISPYSEPIFPMLMFGSLSMKQMAVLGGSMMLAWAIWQNTGSYLAAVPAVAGAALALKKEHVLSPERKLAAIIAFHLGMQRRPKRGTKVRAGRAKRQARKGHSKLMVASKYRAGAASSGRAEPGTRSIPYVMDRAFRMKIRLDDSLGAAIADAEARVVLDGRVLETMRTDGNGQLIVTFMPDSPGLRRLQVFAGSQEPVYEEILDFVR